MPGGSSTLLGPFIIRGGISYAENDFHGRLQVTIKSILLPGTEDGTLAQREHPIHRTTGRIGDPHAGMMYRRTYTTQDSEISSFPVEGDVLPGGSASLLGPFIVRGGITYAESDYHGRLEVTINAVTLTEASGQNTSAPYIELLGQVKSKQPENVLYTVHGIAYTETPAGAPRVGTERSGTGQTHKPVCQKVVVDDKTYPKRILLVASYIGGVMKGEQT
jgi:hypothetical protein